MTVTDAGGNPVSAVTVSFAIASVPANATGQSLSISGATTNATGQASTVLTLGSKAGTYTVTASSGTLTGSPVSFTTTATNPLPTLLSLSPNRGGRGSRINVTITGTNFLADVTTVSFGADITVNSQSVSSATQIAANISISSTASTGGRDVTVTNAGPGGGTSTLTNGFTIDSSTPTIVENNPNVIQQEYVLYDAYPNPFNPSTTIRYGIPEQSKVKIVVVNMIGKVVSQLVVHLHDKGYFEVRWNAENVPSGVYLIRLHAESVESAKSFVMTRKALLLK